MTTSNLPLCRRAIHHLNRGRSALLCESEALARPTARLLPPTRLRARSDASHSHSTTVHKLSGHSGFEANVARRRHVRPRDRRTLENPGLCAGATAWRTSSGPDGSSLFRWSLCVEARPGSAADGQMRRRRFALTQPLIVSRSHPFSLRGSASELFSCGARGMLGSSHWWRRARRPCASQLHLTPLRSAPPVDLHKDATHGSVKEA